MLVFVGGKPENLGKNPRGAWEEPTTNYMNLNDILFDT